MNCTILRRLLTIGALVSIMSARGDDCVPSPTFVPRSQGTNSMLKLVGMTDQTHLYNKECFWGTFALTPLYSQSFHTSRITDALFGSDLLCNVANCTVSDPSCCDNNTRSIIIQGSQVTNRNANAWLADYFYLPTDYQSQISFNPKIKNVLLNVDLYLGLDEWMCGMYFRVYGPFNWTKWELNFCETICTTGTNSSTPGYFAPLGLQRSQLLSDFASYARGEAPGSITGSSTNWTLTPDVPEFPGVTFNGLRYARLDNCSESKSGFADLWLELGWDFLSCTDYHVGAGVLAGVPTGGKRHACRTFDPVIGNGNHWQLGGVLTAHYIFWRSCNEDKQLGVWLDANVTHLFNAREERTYDLCGKPNSRYMLAARMTTPVQLGLTGSVNAGTTAGTTPLAQFADEFAPVANITTFDSRVKIGVQGDVSALLNYTWCDFSLDLGYNFWARSGESIDLDSCRLSCSNINVCAPSQDQAWALKGDARVYGFIAAGNGTVFAGDPVPLSATESMATIHAGTNATATTATNVINPALQNQGVDFPRFAVANVLNPAGVATPTRIISNRTGFDINTNQIKTSLQPVFITCDDIDFRGTKGLSHKVFAHLNYTWSACGCWTPYVGVGGSAEFARNQENCSTNCNNGCIKLKTSACPTYTDCALSQWAVWVKGGISFN